MQRLTRAARQRGRDLRAEGIIQLIVRSPDRAASLYRFTDKIDDQVVCGLLNLSYLADRDGDPAEAMAWADLADQASLFGGTSSGRAEALMHKAILLLDHADRTSTTYTALLDTADQAARAALAIYAGAGPPEDLLTAHQLITRIHQARGDTLSALGSQLDCTYVSAGITDQERAAETVGKVAAMYWQLRDDELTAGAEMLRRDVTALLARAASPRASADLLDALGDAYRRLGAEEAAFETWSAAAAMYRDAGAHEGEFLVRGRMLEFAAELGQAERARQLAEACIASAPPGIPPEQLADRYHLLAAAYRFLGQVDDAVAAYRKAIDLHARGGHGTGAAMTVLLEMALLEADSGRFHDARRDLQQLANLGERSWWLVATTLADINRRHLGDLGAAAAHTETALQLSISTLNNLACRAHSLYQSGILHLMAGDAETAYNRFTQLEPILADPPEPILIKVNRLYDHPVSPPERAECAWWASRACEATGRQDEARSYLRLHHDLLRLEPQAGFPAEAAQYADEHPALLSGRRALASGVSLMRTEPMEALAHLRRARADLAELEETELSARIDAATGSCLLRLNDHIAAATAFLRALETCCPGTDTELELECRHGLACIAAAAELYAEAHAQLTRCVELIEQYRSSIPGVDGRVSFLQGRLPVYELLVKVCVVLNWRAEAFDAVQQVKSRSLVDLLAQPAHQPIDYSLDTRAAELKADRERWIAEYAGDTRWDDPGEFIGSREHQMLDRSIKQDAGIAAIDEERKARGLLEKLHGQGSPVDFTTAKTLLRP